MIYLHFVDEIEAVTLGLRNNAIKIAESFVSNPNLAKTEINTTRLLIGENWVLVTSNFVNPCYLNKAFKSL